MSETLQVIRERRSCKSYKPDMIPEEVIQTIAEAGTWAPSGMGRQSAIIVAITNKELRDRLSRMNAQIMGADMDPFYGAPVVLVVLADKVCSVYEFFRKDAYRSIKIRYFSH